MWELLFSFVRYFQDRCLTLNFCLLLILIREIHDNLLWDFQFSVVRFVVLSCEIFMVLKVIKGMFYFSMSCFWNEICRCSPVRYFVLACERLKEMFLFIHDILLFQLKCSVLSCETSVLTCEIFWIHFKNNVTYHRCWKF